MRAEGRRHIDSRVAAPRRRQMFAGPHVNLKQASRLQFPCISSSPSGVSSPSGRAEFTPKQGSPRYRYTGVMQVQVSCAAPSACSMRCDGLDGRGLFTPTPPQQQSAPSPAPLSAPLPALLCAPSPRGQGDRKRDDKAQTLRVNLRIYYIDEADALCLL